jgi:hypothetical protein
VWQAPPYPPRQHARRKARSKTDSSAHGYDRGRGQQVGEEEQDEGREDKRDVRRWRKRWCTHVVKRPRGRALATAPVDIGTGVGRILGGGSCSHALCREWGGVEAEA